MRNYSWSIQRYHFEVIENNPLVGLLPDDVSVNPNRIAYPCTIEVVGYLRGDHALEIERCFWKVYQNSLVALLVWGIYFVNISQKVIILHKS